MPRRDTFIRDIAARTLAAARAHATLDMFVELGLCLCQLAPSAPPRWHERARSRSGDAPGWALLRERLGGAGVHPRAPWWPRELLLASPVERAAMHLTSSTLFARAATTARKGKGD